MFTPKLPPMTESRLQELYQQHLNKGYWPEFAEIKAKNDFIEESLEKGDYSELYDALSVNIPGVGECQYSGD